MKKLFIITISILLFENVQAQYETAVGLRGGVGSGLTVKHFINDTQALEGILYTRWSGFGAALLMEYHNDLGSADFKWYYGYGAHVGFYDGKYISWGDGNGSFMVAGIDGIIGIEYIIPNAPISLSLDWKPALNLIGGGPFFPDGGAFSVRYTF